MSPFSVEAVSQEGSSRRFRDSQSAWNLTLEKAGLAGWQHFTCVAGLLPGESGCLFGVDCGSLCLWVHHFAP